ncbi:MAG: PIN domain-containing protein [Treponema sp.]|nr:PIN domain-containing protein [Treponema sp.]
MSDRVFVDTNIFVYARDSVDPVKQAAASEVLARLWRERSGRISTQVLSEYFVTVTQKLRPGLDRERAWSDVEALSAWDPAAIDQGTLRKAREIQIRYGLSWWDSLIVAAAWSTECGQIFSEDLGGGQTYLGLLVVNPFQL